MKKTTTRAPLNFKWSKKKTAVTAGAVVLALAMVIGLLPQTALRTYAAGNGSLTSVSGNNSIPDSYTAVNVPAESIAGYEGIVDSDNNGLVAFDFHIFAREFAGTAHTCGNVAVEDFGGTVLGNSGAPEIGSREEHNPSSVKMSYVENPLDWMMVHNDLVLGDGNQITGTGQLFLESKSGGRFGFGNNNPGFLDNKFIDDESDGKPFIDIEQELAEAEQYQKYIDDLSDKVKTEGKQEREPSPFGPMWGQTKGYVYPKGPAGPGAEQDKIRVLNYNEICGLFGGDHNGRTIDFKKFPEKTIIIDLKKGTKTEMGWYGFPGRTVNIHEAIELTRGVVNLKNTSGKRIIFNIDTAGWNDDMVFKPVDMMIDGETNSEETVHLDNNILWNFYNSNTGDSADNKIELNNTWMGTILAPDADVVCKAGLNGSIIANRVTSYNETHKSDYTGERSKGDTSITVYKNWVNDTPDSRPDYITVKLIQTKGDGKGANRKVYKTVQMTPPSDPNTNQWSYTFEKLPKTDAKGNVFKYSVEEEVPAGYIGSVYNYTITNKSTGETPKVDFTGKINVTKTDGSNNLPGARFKLTSDDNANLSKVTVTDADSYSATDNEVIFTTGTKTVKLENVPYGRYTLTEVSAPAGYKLNSNPERFTLTKTNGSNEIVAGAEVSKTITNAPVSAKFVKLESQNRMNLAGATLELTPNWGQDLSGVTVTGADATVTASKITFTSGSSEIVFNKIPEGSYTITETAAPEGYEIAAPVTFNVDGSGNTQINYQNVSRVEMLDDRTPAKPVIEYGNFKLTKKNEAGSYLPGITFTLRNVGGKDISGDEDHPLTVEGASSVNDSGKTSGSISFVTDSGDVTVSNLLAGSYVLEETVPAGYKAVAPRSITITKDNTASDPCAVEIVNEQIKIYISKQDALSGSELSGATLKLTQTKDANGNTPLTPYIAEWSTGEVHELVGVYVGEYKIEETRVPAGYTKADDVIITVNPDGTISGPNTQGSTATVYDTPAVVQIAKEIKDKNKALPGALLQVTPDPDSTNNGTINLDNVNGIYEVTHVNSATITWNSGTTPQELRGLPDGEYILKELQAPEGYKTAAPIKFKVTNGAVASPVKMQDAKVVNFKLDIGKVDWDNHSLFLPGARIGVFNQNAKSFTPSEAISIFTTDETGKTTLILPEGDYVLAELEAPADIEINGETVSYQKTNQKVLFKIKDDGTIEIEGFEDKELAVASYGNPSVQYPGLVSLNENCLYTLETTEIFDQYGDFPSEVQFTLKSGYKCAYFYIYKDNGTTHTAVVNERGPAKILDSDPPAYNVPINIEEPYDPNYTYYAVIDVVNAETGNPAVQSDVGDVKLNFVYKTPVIGGTGPIDLYGGEAGTDCDSLTAQGGYIQGFIPLDGITQFPEGFMFECTPQYPNPDSVWQIPFVQNFKIAIMESSAAGYWETEKIYAEWKPYKEDAEGNPITDPNVLTQVTLKQYDGEELIDENKTYEDYFADNILTLNANSATCPKHARYYQYKEFDPTKTYKLCVDTNFQRSTAIKVSMKGTSGSGGGKISDGRTVLATTDIVTGINETTQNAYINIPNKQRPEEDVTEHVCAVTLTKEDSENHAKLAGAKFVLLDGDGKAVEKLWAPGYSETRDIPADGETEAETVTTYTITPGVYKYSETAPTEEVTLPTGAPTGAVAGWFEVNTSELELETGSDGKIKVTGLNEGTYTFCETEAPNNHNLAENTDVKFVLNLNHTADKPKTITYENAPKKGELTLIKTDENGNPKAGAQFYLYRIKPTEGTDDTWSAGPFTTDNNGKVKVPDLALGYLYYAVETKAAPGTSSANVYTGEAPVPVEYRFPKAENEAPEGSSNTLYSFYNKTAAGNLPYGIILDENSNRNYLLNTEEHENASDDYVRGFSSTSGSITVANDSTQTTILKTDEKGNALAGAEFKLTPPAAASNVPQMMGASSKTAQNFNYSYYAEDANGNRVPLLLKEQLNHTYKGIPADGVDHGTLTYYEYITWTSSATDGGDVIYGLPAGNCTVVETKAPTGYTPIGDSMTVATGGSLTVKNELLSDTISLYATKTLNGRALADEEFSFTLTGDRFDGDNVTSVTAKNDANGNIEFSRFATFTIADLYDADEQAPKFHYTLKENAPTEGGVNKDTREYNIEVRVNLVDGVPKAQIVSLTCKLGDNTSAVSNIRFENEIITNSATISKAEIVNGNDQELPGATIRVESVEFATTGVDLSKVTAKDTAATPADVTLTRGTDSESGKPYIEWESGETAVQLSQLPSGVYSLTEITAPDGYKVAETIYFKVADNGTVYSSDTVKTFSEDWGDSADKVVMHDAPMTATISKQSTTGSAELTGATLIVESVGNTVDFSKITGTRTVKNDNGEDTVQAVELTRTGVDGKTDNTYVQWVSGTAPVTLSRLPAGVYTLTEITAPNGYAVAEVIYFKVDENGDVYNVSEENYNGADTVWGNAKDQVVMKDAPIAPTFSKQSTTDTEELPGATLIIEAVGNNVDFSGISKIVQNESGQDVTTDDGLTKTGVDGKTDNKYVQWVSGETPVTLTNLPAGVYTLTEITAPNGYAVAEVIYFKVDDNGKVYSVSESNYNGDSTDWGSVKSQVVMKDAPHNATISKRVTSGTTELPGAVLTITPETEGVKLDKVGRVDNTAGEEFAATEGSVTWKSTTKSVELTRLPTGVYKLTETTKPFGYEQAEDIYFKVAADGTVSCVEAKDYDGDNTVWKTASGNTVIMYDDAVTLVAKISKRETGAGTDEIPGALLTVEALNGTKFGEDVESKLTIIEDTKSDTIRQWVSTSAPNTLTNLEAGEYRLIETTEPEGYLKAEEIYFKIDLDGTVYNKTKTEYETEGSVWRPVSETHTVIMYDSIIREANISKQATGSGDELPGATLTVTALTEGVKLSDVHSELNTEDRTDTTITWKSGDAPNKLSMLPVGVYELKEETAPNGYTVAEKIYFKVEKNGTVKSVPEDDYKGADTEWAPVDGKKIIMKDAPTSATISKQATGSGDELPGARLTVTAMDENGSVAKVDSKLTAQKSEDNKSISWTSGETPNELTKLPAGVYELKEETAPNGYTVAEKIYFKVENDGTIKSVPEKDYKGNDTTWAPVDDKKIIMKDAPGTATISKVAPGSGDELPGATLTVTALNENADLSKVGSKLTADKSDDKKSISWTSGDKPNELTMLPAGVYELCEVTAPNGYEVAEKIYFKVEKDGTVKSVPEKDYKGNDTEWKPVDDKKIIMEDAPTPSKDLTATISKVATDSGKELPGAKLTVTAMDSDVTLENVTSTLKSEKSENNKSISWTSGETPNELSKLPAGIYELKEETAPEGYTVAEKIYFKVDEDGTVYSVPEKDYKSDGTTQWVKATGGKVIMKDAPSSKQTPENTYNFSFTKKNNFEENLAGATFQLKGNDYEKTATSDAAGKVSFADVKKGTYSLTETAAPTGYNKYTGTITVTVSEDGNFTFKDYNSALTLAQVEKALVNKVVVQDGPGNKNMNIGDTINLKQYLPDAYKNKEIIWKTEDGRIVSVDQNGLAKVMGAGETKIYACSKDGTPLMSFVLGAEDEGQTVTVPNTIPDTRDTIIRYLKIALFALIISSMIVFGCIYLYKRRKKAKAAR